MRKFILFSVLGAALSAPATAADKRCDAWAEYMAKMVVSAPLSAGTTAYPSYGASGGNVGGFAGAYPTETVPFGGVRFGGSEGGFPGSIGQQNVPWLNDEVKSSPKLKELNDRRHAQADAYKKALFDYGNKNKCMQAFEAAVHKRQTDEVLAQLRSNYKATQEKDLQIERLRGANSRALEALEECKLAAPKIANNLQKQIDEITRRVNSQEECTHCVNGASTQAGSAKK